jgi:Na+/melibiose symporter-like transporter
LIGFAFWGVSTAFSSGAGNAWLYDSLKALGKEKTLTKHLGRLSSMFISVDILSSILAPLLFALNVRLPYYVALVAMLVVIAIQLSMFEREAKVIASGLELIKENLKQITSSISLIRGNKIFIWLTFLGFIFFASSKAISEIVSGPFLTTVAGYSVPTLSIILSIASLIQTTTVFFADKFEDKLGLKWSLVLLLLMSPISILLYSLTRGNVLLTAVIVGFYFSLVSFSEVVFESNLSHRLPDNRRAISKFHDC